MEDINPFEQHVVNMMLNKLGAPIGKMEKINGAFPAVVTGQCLEVGGARYNNLRKLTDGQFAKKYVGKCQERHVSLKVGYDGLLGAITINFVIVTLSYHVMCRFKVQQWNGNWQLLKNSIPDSTAKVFICGR